MNGSILSPFEQVLLHVQLTVVRIGWSNIYRSYPKEINSHPAPHIHRGKKLF